MFGVAAATPVPSPMRIPVTVVSRVIAGVVVESATLPAKPFADTTETSVTVPEPEPVAEICFVPFTFVIEIPEPAETVSPPPCCPACLSAN